MNRFERTSFLTVSLRLSAILHYTVSVEQLNMLAICWNKQRERRGKNPINFRQRVKDEVAWQRKHGLPVSRERFFFPDELELFSRYVGYDVTK